MVIGSGVYRIGSSVEFDWCAVRSIQVDIESDLLCIACFSRQNFETDKRKPAEPVSDSYVREEAGNRGCATTFFRFWKQRWFFRKLMATGTW
jgi:hypothetical protein